MRCNHVWSFSQEAEDQIRNVTKIILPNHQLAEFTYGLSYLNKALGLGIQLLRKCRCLS